LALWTATSIRSSRSAASMAVTNAPSPHGVSAARRSPSVVMTVIELSIPARARAASTNRA